VIGLKVQSERDCAMGICRLIIKNKINTPWTCSNGIRADMVNDELMGLMKKTGCYYCGIGIESANNEILKNVNKGETIEVIQNAINIMKKNKIECGGFFIFVCLVKQRRLFRIQLILHLNRA
jgi:radical SAM superfamily enzyme YgiQ (UPF0313 family)